ncbi:hypothetical protein KGY77_11320 [Candidatus Bipolaricaulota bacterium]|nr:hypothetical protein [Candidatus Bipolaricaulota bacterium]
MLILTRRHLKRIIGMEESIDTMEKAFRAFYRGNTKTPLRQKISVPGNGGNALYMPCLIEQPDLLRALGIKVVTVYESNPDRGLPTIFGIYVLNQPETGKPLAILEASYLTGLRTAAVTGLGLRFLARSDADRLGIIGSGYQAYFQALASDLEQNLNEIRLYDKETTKALDLQNRLSKQLQKKIIVSNSPNELVEKSEIIITVTNASDPVFSGDRLSQGDTIIAVGAYKPDAREVDSVTVQRANIWVDSLETSLEEAGDLIIPIEKGKLNKRAIMGELGGVLEGETPSRSSKQEITLFESVGLAFEDTALAKVAYDRASESQEGVEVNFN